MRSSSTSYQKSEYPTEWDVWLRLPPPRVVRMRNGQRFWIALIFAAMIAVSITLLGALLVELQAHPARKTMTDDVWMAVSFIAGGLFFALIIYLCFRRDRRLVRDGQIAIGKVTAVRIGRRGIHLVNYEFLDRSGRMVTMSCPDNTRKFSEGMAMPVFFNPEKPESDQVALCQSTHEVAVVL